jgi:LPS sulfotransferase NodH
MSYNFSVDRKRLPSFIGIGGQRCGSTWLDKVLRTHPQISLAPKESNFFNLKIMTNELSWYYELFETNSTKPINLFRGDISPTYSAMYSEQVSLIKILIPDLKIIFTIRNPVDRLSSQITRQWTYHKVDKGASTTRNILALLRQVDTSLSRRLTDYLRTYCIWSKFYGRDNIFIETYDNLEKDPKGFIKQMLTFLEIDSDYLFPEEFFLTRPNKSSNQAKSEIPEILRCYLAWVWLPKIRELQDAIQFDLSAWIEEMEDILSKMKYSYLFVFIFHQIYFYIPYKIVHTLLNPLRIRFQIIKAKRNIFSF